MSTLVTQENLNQVINNLNSNIITTGNNLQNNQNFLQEQIIYLNNNNSKLDLSKIKKGSRWVGNKDTFENCYLDKKTNELKVVNDTYAVYKVDDIIKSEKYENVIYIKFLLDLYLIDNTLLWSDKLCLGIIHGHEMTIVEGAPFKRNPEDSDTIVKYKLDKDLNINPSSNDLFIKRFVLDEPTSILTYVGNFKFEEN